MRRLAALLLLASAAACTGLAPPHAARLELAAYFDAVQADDRDRMFAALADCQAEALAGDPEAARRACSERVGAVAASVAAQRELGEYRFDDALGIGLVTALVLGRGAYWTVVEAEAEGDHLEATVRVRTQYRADETKGLPGRAVIEYLVKPFGTVQRMGRRERGPGGLRWQLDQVDLHATFRRMEGTDGERRWRLVSLEPIRESAVFSQVTWRPL